MKETVLEFDQLCQDYITALYHNASGFITYEPGEKESHAERKIFLTYGEILYNSVGSVMEHLEITEDDVFYDFGSGIGKVTLQFFLRTPVKKAHGIEYSIKRNVVAEKIYRQVKREFPELFYNNRELDARQGNFMEVDISDATIIYTCSTCFDDVLLNNLGQLFDQYPKIRYIISMKPIPLKLPLQNIFDLECTWDKTKCYLYSKEGGYVAPEIPLDAPSQEASEASAGADADARTKAESAGKLSE